MSSLAPIPSVPAALEAEIGLLSVLLVACDETYHEVKPLLGRGDFMLIKHQFVWDAITALVDNGTPVDVVTIGSHLKSRGLLDAVGGYPFLTSLVNDFVTSVWVVDYAKMISVAAGRRRLMALSDRLKSLAGDETKDFSALLSTAEAEFESLRMDNNRAPLISVGQAADDDYNRVMDILDGKIQAALPSSLALVNFWIDGYRRGEVICYAARPGVGKTTMLQTEALHLAEQGKVVVYAGLEQAPMELTRGLIAIKSGLPYSAITNARFSGKAELDIYSEAQAEVRKLPIWFADPDEALTPANLAAKVKTAIRRYNADVVIVDYIGLMEDDTKSDSRTQELASISRKIKRMARKTGLPFIVASQLNRGSEATADREPTLTNLAESDGLGRDADVVMFLWRESGVDIPETGEGVVLTRISVGKNRNGMTGKGTICLLVPSKKFTDYTDRLPPATKGRKS